jgi:CheY-like chemotaxis protein
VTATGILFELGAPVFTFDLRGQIVYSNRAAQRAFRAEPDSNLRDLVSGANEADALIGLAARLRPGTAVVLVVNFLIDSNQTVAARLVCSYLDDDPRASTCVIIDPISCDSVTVPRPEVVASNVLRFRGAETILVVEDEPTVRSLVRRVLERKGYRVLVAPDAASALTMAENHSLTIDLLLTDLVMPGMGGRDLAAAMNAQVANLRVIYMSGYSQDAITTHGVLDSGTAFLEKPFTTKALADKVREVLDSSPIFIPTASQT